MKTITPRIEKAIDIFLDAINNGTLAKGTCNACAVGNLVANGMGIPVEVYSNIYGRAANWRFAFCTSGTTQEVCPDFFKDIRVEECVNASGFKLSELMKIEKAFESNTSIHQTNYDDHDSRTVRADQIRGLEAVVKVMLTFDDCKEVAQEVFTKRAELIPINP